LDLHHYQVTIIDFIIFQEEYFKLLKEKLDKVNSELAMKTQQNTKSELVSDY
jgi:hypothetical protein